MDEAQDSAGRRWLEKEGSSLGPSVELPMGPRNAVLGVADACAPPSLGPSVELPMGPRNVVLGVADACAPPYLDLR